MDLVKYTILGAVGEDCRDLTMAETKGCYSNYMIMSHRAGKYKGIKFDEKFERNNLLDMYCSYKDGDEVHPYRNTTDMLGTIIFKANSVEEMKDLISSMGRAYIALPIVMIITYNLFEKRDKKDIVFAILGCVFLLLCATRGPLLLYLVFLGVLSVMYGSFALAALMAFFGVLIGIKSIRTPLLFSLRDIVRKRGYDSRIFDYILNSNVTDDNGRNEMYKAVREMIIKNPFGNGLYSDRRATSRVIWVYRRSGIYGDYAHNFIYEVLCQFGLIIGSLFLLVVLRMIIISLLKIDDSKRILLIILICSYLGRLFFSSSYLKERGFFVLMGLCFSINRACSRVRLSFGTRGEVF